MPPGGAPSRVDTPSVHALKQQREEAAFNRHASKFSAGFWQWKAGLHVVRKHGQPDPRQMVWQCCALCFDVVAEEDPAFLRSPCSDVPRAEVDCSICGLLCRNCDRELHYGGAPHRHKVIGHRRDWIGASGRRAFAAGERFLNADDFAPTLQPWYPYPSQGCCEGSSTYRPVPGAPKCPLRVTHSDTDYHGVATVYQCAACQQTVDLTKSEQCNIGYLPDECDDQSHTRRTWISLPLVQGWNDLVKKIFHFILF